MIIISRLPGLYPLPDIPYDILCFIKRRIKLAHVDLVTLTVIRPEGLVLSPVIVADHRIGSI